jgi:hypothetical protein
LFITIRTTRNTDSYKKTKRVQVKIIPVY